MSSRVAVAGLLVVAARVAAAQETAVFFPNDREASAQVARIVASAEAAGLPTNPIVGRVQYGLLVPRSKPSAIVAAASAVAARLETARTALAPNATQSEIEAGANALGEKATPEALRAVRQASGSRPIVVPLGVLTQLLSSKVPLSRATEIVTDLIKRNATPNQLVALGNDVASDVARGTAADAAIDLRTRGLIAVLAAPGGAAAATAGDLQTVNAPSTIGTAGAPGPRQAPARPPRP